jgi:hypothetical protein
MYVQISVYCIVCYTVPIDTEGESAKGFKAY